MNPAEVAEETPSPAAQGRTFPLSLPSSFLGGGSTVTSGCFLAGAAAGTTIPLLGLATNVGLAPTGGPRRAGSGRTASARKRPRPEVDGAPVSVAGSLLWQEKKQGLGLTGKRKGEGGIDAFKRINRRSVGSDDINGGALAFEEGLWSMCPPHLSDGGSVITSDEEDADPQTRARCSTAPEQENRQLWIAARDDNDDACPTVPDVNWNAIRVGKRKSRRYRGATALPAASTIASGPPSSQATPFLNNAASRASRGSNPETGLPSKDLIARLGKGRHTASSKALSHHTGKGSNKPGKANKATAVSRRLDGIVAAYATDDPASPPKQRAGGKRARGRREDGQPTTGRWRTVGTSAAGATVGSAVARRMRQLEEMMGAAMESPVTYEEQVRRERLAHLRVVYEVEKQMTSLPVDFLRDVGCEGIGINRRLSRMCALLRKSHRRARSTAFSRWANLVEFARAERFSLDMQNYEHARLLGILAAAEKRWKLKHLRRRFFTWRRGVRLAHKAEHEARSAQIAVKIQRWARRQLTLRRRRRALENRDKRRAEIAREKNDAIDGVLCFENNRRKCLWQTLSLLEEKRRYDAFHRAATALQRAWLRHVLRLQILEFAKVEHRKLADRRSAVQEKRWFVVEPMVHGLLSVCLDRAGRAALAKTRACHEHNRLVYEVKLAEHLRSLGEAQSVLARVWKGKRARVEFLLRRQALVSVQRAWRRVVARRSLQREIDARVEATAERIAALRLAATIRVQKFALKCADRRRLFQRFTIRRARLDFERRNRAELASAILVLCAPASTIRDCSSPEDLKAMEGAVMPALAVARLRASAASLGVSLKDLSLSTGRARAGEGEVDESMLGGELARAVLQQQETQRRAAEAVQIAWRRRKANRLLDERFATRKEKLKIERRERGVSMLKRAWACYKIWREITARVERTRARIAVERDTAVRLLQRFCRRRKGAKELASRFAVRKIILEQEKSLRDMTAAATTIQLWYRKRVELYYMTIRIVSRYRIAFKHAAAAEEAYQRRREEAATVVQLAWRSRSMRVYLFGRFEARRARISRDMKAASREAAALVLQSWWHRLQARRMLKGRFAKRARIMMKLAEEEETARVEDGAARVLQRAWGRHSEWEKMKLRFCLRRKVLDETFALEESKRMELEALANEKLEAERRMKREHEGTKVTLLLVESERDRKAAEAASHLLNAWKLGYDQENSRNFWFNHVTGESSTTRPEGWTIKPSERWHKQMNDKGMVYYLDLETGETHWFPPCENCYKREGERVCEGCDGQVYCGRCWNMEHKSEDMASHDWKGAESGKEDLSPGERHCVDCGFRKAKWTCLQCKDALCGECSARIHGSGHRKNHQVESYAKSKKGWQTVEGRTDNEPTFYFNATSNESTFEKPQELMLPEELVEHKKFLEYKAVSEKYVKKIEKLQFQLEELMYEKDKIAYQWANAQKDMNVKGSELKSGGLSIGGLKLGGGKKKEKKGAEGAARTPAQEEAYKKSLLVSRKEKKEMGFEVKLKK